MPEGDRNTNFQIHVPADLETGDYANFLTVWHTAYEFTLDFCATQPAHPEDEADPESAINVPCHVVSRVKIPPALVFDILRALNENMSKYESTYGDIHRPESADG